MEYKDVITRINGYLLEKSITQRSLVDTLKINKTSINDYLTGKTKISADFLIRFFNAYPDLSCDWVFKGTGSMIKTAQGTTYNVDLSDSSISGGTNSFGSGSIKMGAEGADKDLVSALIGAMQITQQQNAALLETVKKLSSK